MNAPIFALIFLVLVTFGCKFKSTEVTKFTSSNNNLEVRYKENYSSGEKGAEFTTTSGELDGEILEYYKNGNLKHRGNYINGKKNGKHFYYSIDGKVVDERIYSDDFLLDQKGERYSGKRNVFNESKIVILEENYENGKLYGLRKEFSEEGELLIKEEYLNNVLINESSFFSQEGKKIQSAFYSSNGDLLKVIYYDDNGQIISEKKY